MDQQNQPEPEVPASYAEALRYMVAKPFLGTARYRAQQWTAERRGAHPQIVEFETAFVRRFRSLGIPMFAHCIERSNATQARLYVQGVTKAKPGQSPHNFGCAVDLVHGVKAWNLPKPCWDLMGHIGKEIAAQRGIKLVWGGDWRFYDPAHWELGDWEALSRVPESWKPQAQKPPC